MGPRSRDAVWPELLDLPAPTHHELAELFDAARHDDGCMCPECRPDLVDDERDGDDELSPREVAYREEREQLRFEREHSAAVLG